MERLMDGSHRESPMRGCLKLMEYTSKECWGVLRSNRQGISSSSTCYPTCAIWDTGAWASPSGKGCGGSHAFGAEPAEARTWEADSVNMDKTAKLFLKIQIINIVGFSGHMPFVSPTQLYFCCAKMMYKNECGLRWWCSNKTVLTKISSELNLDLSFRNRE